MLNDVQCKPENISSFVPGQAYNEAVRVYKTGKGKH